MNSRDFQRALRNLARPGARVRYWLNAQAEIIGVRVQGITGIPGHRMTPDALIPYLTV